MFRDRGGAGDGSAGRRQRLRPPEAVDPEGHPGGRQAEIYDKQGKLAKVEIRRKPVRVVADAWRVDEVEMQDVQNGTKTILLVESRRFNVGLKDSFFSEAELTR